MGVFNGEEQLVPTVKSILEQTLTEFEFIVIDDGSTDRTAHILDDYAAKDSRLRIVHQENTGLTRALIHGCSLARGEFIARQDAGDISFPDRLEVQAKLLSGNSDAVMVACGTEFVTPANEVLFQSISPGKQLDSGLRELSVSKIKGPPHHGGTMFRRDAYDKCGGYRHQFKVAQDIDLWLRLSALGSCLGTREVLYKASVGPGNISFMRWREQEYFLRLAVDSAILRNSGADDAHLFESIKPPRAGSWGAKRKGFSRYYYFIASNVAKTDSAAARGYFSKAFRHNPFHLKALLRHAQLTITKSALGKNALR